MQVLLASGVRYLPCYLDRVTQERLIRIVYSIIEKAPLYIAALPRTGKLLSVRMTNCGSLGWVSDKEGGYRYQPTHPVTGLVWPPIPSYLFEIWNAVSGYDRLPQACLVNFYDASAKMGLHQDQDEQDLLAPVVSISLGDTCLFRIGGLSRRSPIFSMRLESGDVVILEGKSRLIFHGVGRIYPGSSTLLNGRGRINLTLGHITAF